MSNNKPELTLRTAVLFTGNQAALRTAFAGAGFEMAPVDQLGWKINMPGHMQAIPTGLAHEPSYVLNIGSNTITFTAKGN